MSTKVAESNNSTEPQFGKQYKLIGKDYVTADLHAKVTGQAKYAEDFRAEGMLFCKLLLSPLPHARVRHIDTTASILNALSDALGDEIFQRAPVNLDTILTSLEAGRPMQHPLTAHI